MTIAEVEDFAFGILRDNGLAARDPLRDDPYSQRLFTSSAPA
jgi:hypothetical protein